MNKCKVIFGKKSFNWMPPNIDNDDEKQWNDNYISLLHEPDDMECNIGCGDDILSLWKQVVDDDDKYIAEINVYVETQGESEYKLYNEQIDESSFPPSLYRFNSKDICNKIQQWVYNDINYRKHLQKTQIIMSNASLDGCRIICINGTNHFLYQNYK